MWLVFALLSAVMAALVAVFGKIGLKNIDSNTATAIRSVIMAVFLIIVVLVQGKFNQISTIFANRKAITFIVLSGLAGAMSWLFYFLALKLGDVSKVAPIDKLSVVIAVILSVIFLGEKLTTATVIGVALITAGALVIALA